MEARVKAYLVQKFDTCCRTGQKADPVQVARKVKIAKDDAGICCLPHRNGEHMSTADEEFFSHGFQQSSNRHKWKKIRVKCYEPGINGGGLGFRSAGK